MDYLYFDLLENGHRNLYWRATVQRGMSLGIGGLLCREYLAMFCVM